VEAGRDLGAGGAGDKPVHRNHHVVANQTFQLREPEPLELQSAVLKTGGTHSQAVPR
jgi:hypothetical protein